MNERNILVIGGAGYIGSVLVQKLLNIGHCVRVLDCLMWDNGSAICDLYDHNHFSFIYGDFGNKETLNSSLQGITDVVLLASLVGDPICKKYPELAKKVNQENTINLLNNLHSSAVEKFVFASTCSNYGLQKNKEPATEESELNPQSLYAETKIVVENYILDHFQDWRFSPTILRFSTAYGLSRRMRFDLTIADFCKELFIKKELLVYDENTWRPYCHNHDISDAIIKILSSPNATVSGQVYNIGSNEENYTKKMIVDITAKLLNEPLQISYKEHGFDPRNYFVSFDKMKQQLGFEPKKRIDTFLPSLIESLRLGMFNDIESRKNFYGNYEISKDLQNQILNG